MNATKIIFNPKDPFRVISVDNQIDRLNIYVQSKRKSSHCPNCLEASSRTHSYYTRKFMDLPSFGKSTTIFLRARKFYCRTDECPFKVFTERFNDHFEPYKRLTNRLSETLLKIALEAGGKSGERICRQCSIGISDSTLLRIIYNADLPNCKEVIALGVDDWAIKKRDRYGSILVDLTTNKPIALLADREENTLTAWLKDRPEIQIVSRDRYGNYQRAASKGAPQAVQVTDRWHLLKNLGEAVRKVIDREHASMKKVRTVYKETRQAKIEPPKSLASERQHEKFREVKKMLNEGVSIKEIARTFKMSRITIRKYRYCEELPRRNYPSPSGLEKHLTYIKERLKEVPELQLKQLLAELTDRGYPGAYSTLSDGLARYGFALGKKRGRKTILPSNLALWRPSKTSMLFFGDKQKLTTQEQDILEGLCKQSVTLNQTREIVVQFRQMMLKERTSAGLKEWIWKVENSAIPELRGFANGLLQDFEPVKNAFDYPWSNGPVEGNVNKLKTIKRQMYGRSSLNLLERRLVLTPS
ncbi:ISL3 family transposase [Chitinophaga rhizosphaerae]|uniref:ISL3 family transposase n=1 Tax=Chitinophaga rhizosphaerae TaxID=1864947 RepID=UPI000F805342|nr:ISL3 family transposase [Chitinophaga rhizosphaerae]